jgi:hypothetical protein
MEIETLASGLPEHEIKRRLREIHPKARVELAKLTDSRSYKGPHNIVASEEPEYRFLGLHWLTWIGMSAIAGAGWLASLPL